MTKSLAKGIGYRVEGRGLGFKEFLTSLPSTLTPLPSALPL